MNREYGFITISKVLSNKNTGYIPTDISKFNKALKNAINNIRHSFNLPNIK